MKLDSQIQIQCANQRTISIKFIGILDMAPNLNFISDQVS